MKTTTAILLLSCCVLAQDKRAISRAEVGCGPQDVKYEVKTDESQHPAPTPEDGKALIYFVADGHLTSIFGFDEKWEGAVDGGRYFFVSIEPGEHHVCAMLQTFVRERGPEIKSSSESLHHCFDEDQLLKMFACGMLIACHLKLFAPHLGTNDWPISCSMSLTAISQPLSHDLEFPRARFVAVISAYPGYARQGLHNRFTMASDRLT